MTQYLTASEIVRLHELTKDLPRDSVYVYEKGGKKIEVLVSYLRYAYEYVTSMREEEA